MLVKAVSHVLTQADIKFPGGILQDIHLIKCPICHKKPSAPGGTENWLRGLDLNQRSRMAGL